MRSNTPSSVGSAAGLDGRPRPASVDRARLVIEHDWHWLGAGRRGDASLGTAFMEGFTERLQGNTYFGDATSGGKRITLDFSFHSRQRETS